MAMVPRPGSNRQGLMCPADFKSAVSTNFTTLALWWAQQDSNLRPKDYESSALTN
jgi:hypothetical protein